MGVVVRNEVTLASPGTHTHTPGYPQQIAGAKLVSGPTLSAAEGESVLVQCGQVDCCSVGQVGW